ncbi:hypothetical protein HK101_000220 [Irineochytrium annulatum]|nr:hypothetical protein HK101_000220 [Irineochytrium annulatum]
MSLKSKLGLTLRSLSRRTDADTSNSSLPSPATSLTSPPNASQPATPPTSGSTPRVSLAERTPGLGTGTAPRRESPPIVVSGASGVALQSVAATSPIPTLGQTVPGSGGGADPSEREYVLSPATDDTSNLSVVSSSSPCGLGSGGKSSSQSLFRGLVVAGKRTLLGGSKDRGSGSVGAASTMLTVLEDGSTGNTLARESTRGERDRAEQSAIVIAPLGGSACGACASAFSLAIGCGSATSCTPPPVAEEVKFAPEEAERWRNVKVLTRCFPEWTRRMGITCEGFREAEARAVSRSPEGEKIRHLICDNQGRIIELYVPCCIETKNLREQNIAGEIPKELCQLDALKKLWLQRNKFSGKIPVELTQVAKLELLSLENNKLTGPVPFELEGNKLTGVVPASLQTLKKLYDMNLSGNRFDGANPLKVEDLVSMKFDPSRRVWKKM